jgi:hypothetical protein
MYLFRLNSFYRISPPYPELPRETSGITRKRRIIGFVILPHASTSPALVTLRRSSFPPSKHIRGRKISSLGGTPSPGRPQDRRDDPNADAAVATMSVLIAASVYNWLKNLSSIARRADSRVTQAACMVIDIDPRILSS